jgi:N-acetylglutamate synthase-like GNAT family acetyltransferase
MTVLFRPVAQTDWADIGRLADEALPHSSEGNREWLEARRSLDELRRRRRQYIVQEDGEVVGYGAIEEDEDPGRWRLFVVMSPERLNGPHGNRTFARMLSEAKAVGAEALWMREEASDKAIATFARRHEFVETQRYNAGALRVVVYERSLS